MTDEEIRQALDRARKALDKMGVFERPHGLRWAAAHGIVLSVWRNGPIEDAHASPPTKRRKRLHDGVMFARNTWLTQQAFDVLGSSKSYRLLRLERVILDGDAIWPGTDGTLTDFGWGFLGEIKNHVKQRINTLLHFEDQLSPDDFLVFAGAPQIGTHVGHFGMPKWPACVNAAVHRLRGEDEEFFREWDDLMQRVGPAPDTVTSDLEATEKVLLNAPWELGAEVLKWFAWNPILHLE